jgi:NAD+ synthase
MPERHSSADSLALGRTMVDALGIQHAQEDISSTLEAVGFYARYDAAVRSVIPDYGKGWTSKLVMPGVFQKSGFTLFSIVAKDLESPEITVRLPLSAYLEILAATNFKQRIRKMMEYHHADRLHFAVLGTPNRLEFDQGFFVKQGDGAADLKPIAHLYKTQVYQMAGYLNIPDEILSRPPTTDTFSMPQGQDEFYFALPYRELPCMYALNNDVPAEDVAGFLGYTSVQVQRVWDDIIRKRTATRYLHLGAQVIQD